MSASAIEVNFDGLVGPTHHYGGLSHGNVASMTHGGAVSNPRAAVRQGIAKARWFAERGMPQGFLPPHERPFLPALRALGFTGSPAAAIEAAWSASPLLLSRLSSASPMWTANAATVSPSADSADGRVHVTPANLGAMLHRSIEAPTTARALKAWFPEGAHFAHHEPVPYGGGLGDEGAANHNRLAPEHGAPGVQVFVYGGSALTPLAGPERFVARQALEASEAVARLHRLEPARTLFIQQSPEAIDAGAFHNDVVAVSNGRVFLYHEKAFADRAGFESAVRRSCEAAGFEPVLIMVRQDEVPLADAVASYLFNSQLVSLPAGGEGDAGMALILPQHVADTPSAKAWVDGALGSNGPIREAHYVDLHQSMANGGGPACLRLRVVLTEVERAAMPGWEVLAPGGRPSESLFGDLDAWAQRHYRDRLTAEDLRDPLLYEEGCRALDELTQILRLGALYDFQRD